MEPRADLKANCEGAEDLENIFLKQVPTLAAENGILKSLYSNNL